MKRDVLLSILLIILLVVFLNPMNIFMPPAIVMMLVVVLIVFFSLFAAIVWKEKVRDEREALLSQKSGRIAFLTGTTILVGGIAYQELQHQLDPWLVYALVTMILGKIFGYWYAQQKN